MILKYLSPQGNEDYLTVTHEEISLRDFANEIMGEYKKYVNFDMRLLLTRSMNGIVLLIHGGTGEQLLELQQIGSGEKVKYFCINKPDSSDEKQFDDFYKFLIRQV